MEALDYLKIRTQIIETIKHETVLTDSLVLEEVVDGLELHDPAAVLNAARELLTVYPELKTITLREFNRNNREQIIKDSRTIALKYGVKPENY